MSNPSDSPQEIDTIPNTPVNVADDHDNDFAILIPTNDAARIAFSAVAELIRLDSDRMPHARRFVHINPNRSPLSPDTSTDTDTSEQGGRPLLHSGYYRFNLDIQPGNPRLGWVIGRGTEDQREEKAVDLSLSITAGKGVRRDHARITFDFKTNILILVAEKGRKVLVNGKHELKGSQRVLGDLVTSLDFGELRYKFQYTVQGHSAYQQRLAEYKADLGLPPTVGPQTVAPTPSCHDYEFHGYFLKPAFEAGSTCTVLAGVHQTTGALVAVKRMNRSKRNASHISHEIDILHSIQKYDPHPNICRLVDDILTGNDRHGPIDSRIDEVYLIYTPLAANTFDHLISSGVNRSDRVFFFKQVLQGVAYLHSIGVMHRDIKPANLMVVSYRPPRGMITDFGHATFEKTSKDHHKGTLCYLAPEVWNLKRGGESAPAYDELVDIFALGVTAYQLLCFRTWWWGEEVSAEVSERVDGHLEHLDKSLPTGVPLLRNMLARDPAARISAKNALETTFMRYTMAPGDEHSSAEMEQSRKKMKR